MRRTEAELEPVIMFHMVSLPNHRFIRWLANQTPTYPEEARILREYWREATGGAPPPRRWRLRRGRWNRPR